MNEITLDCSGIDSPRELHHTLAEALRFPEWYGNNLDALHDCLTSIEEETTLTLLHFEQMGKWAIGFRRVLTDCQEENPHFHVTFL